MSCYMQTEIHEQPVVIRRLLSEEGTQIRRVAAALRQRQPTAILIAARGTSDNAATYAKYLFGLVNRTIVALAAPSLTTLYGVSLNLAQVAVIGISQSGESTDVIEVMRQAKASGALTIGITNNPASPLATAVQYPIALHAGEERALPATKTYTAQLVALAMLSAHLAEHKEMIAGLETLPEAMQTVLQVDSLMAETAERYRSATRCVCLARGVNYATALEAALKLKETCYLGAEPYSTADFMHGPIAVVEPGFPALLFAPPGRALPPMVEMAQALAQRGAASVIISSTADVLKLAAIPVVMPVQVDELLTPILYIVPAQFLALYLSQAKGIDPDAPRGLRKVTLTR